MFIGNTADVPNVAGWTHNRTHASEMHACLDADRPHVTHAEETEAQPKKFRTEEVLLAQKHVSLGLHLCLHSLQWK